MQGNRSNKTRCASWTAGDLIGNPTIMYVMSERDVGRDNTRTFIYKRSKNLRSAGVEVRPAKQQLAPKRI